MNNNQDKLKEKIDQLEANSPMLKLRSMIIKGVADIEGISLKEAEILLKMGKETLSQCILNSDNKGELSDNIRKTQKSPDEEVKDWIDIEDAAWKSS